MIYGITCSFKSVDISQIKEFDWCNSLVFTKFINLWRPACRLFPSSTFYFVFLLLLQFLISASLCFFLFSFFFFLFPGILSDFNFSKNWKAIVYWAIKRKVEWSKINKQINKRNNAKTDPKYALEDRVNILIVVSTSRWYDGHCWL